MPSLRYDVIVIADLRFPGGTSTAIAEELRAQAAAGYRTGVIQTKGPVLKQPHPIHPEIQACLDAGLAEMLDPTTPAEAGLLIAHHPSLFTHPPRQPLAITAEARLLVVHHPPFDGDGEPAYALDRVARHAEQTLGGPTLWAPVGPAVRAQFAGLDDGPLLLGSDWHNILDASAWHLERAEALEARPIIGRHSRPDPLKWPDDRATTLAVYPDHPDFGVRILGGGPFLRALVGAYPPNWRVWSFNALTPQRFLGMIDFFVYYHHSRWVEAFGRTILEAMASGAVCVLPPSFEPLFGPAAVYAPPAEVQARVRELHVDRRAYRRQGDAGAALVRGSFGPACHVERLRGLIGGPRPTVAATRAVRRRRVVLFMTSNGVGLGHLTRMLAVGRRCPSEIEPVFLTLSRAFAVVREQGFLAEHLPFHHALGCDPEPWNRFLREELNEILAFYQPAVLVFDGNVPYQGLVDALLDRPGLWSAWCRRGMWQPGHGRAIIGRERHFDVVIEPGDLAGDLDRGLTTEHRERTRAIGPVRLLDRDEMLSREAARAGLELAPDRPAVLLQLGAGNNYDYEPIKRSALELLAKRHEAQVLVAESPIADIPLDLPAWVRRIAIYPLSRHLKAFDLALSAVGYNSFHELLLAGIPAVYVPNENPQQDDQLGRARFAEQHGLGACVRAGEIYRLQDALEQLLDPAERAEVGGRCERLDHGDGARDAASLVAEMAYSLRMDQQ